jgi:hypothetical protein
MNKSASLLAALLFPAFVLAGFIATPAMAQEKTKAVKQGTTKSLLENDKVKAYEVTYKPGQGSDSRDRPARLTRAITGGTMMRTYPDGKTEKVVWKTGDTKWFPKETFGNKNVGKTVVKLLVVQPK